LADGACIAVLVDADGAAAIGRPDPAVRTDVLERLVRVYANTAPMYRSETAEFASLRVEFGPGAAVRFPDVGKDDIVRLAMAGRRLPAGITRHLIPGRVLRLNVPLAWLEAPEAAAVKQARLDDSVQARVHAHGTRYYAEATHLFDE